MLDPADEIDEILHDGRDVLSRIATVLGMGKVEAQRDDLVRAMRRIADMDPKGQRADDLGRAARIARVALQHVSGVQLTAQLQQENHHESSPAQAPDVGVDVAGILALQPAGREASAQAAGAEGAKEPCGHMKRGARKWHCRRCMEAAYPGVPFEEAARRFRDASGVEEKKNG